MRDPNFIATLIAMAIAAILPQVPDLTDAELAELIAAERAQDGGGRKTLLEALELIQMEREERAAEAAAKAAANEQPTVDAAAPAGDAPWQEPDYCGPLSGGQAMWRNANLKG